MHFVQAKGILSERNGMNLYRGCTHGCIYCDSRSACYHIDHLFEDIEVKANAIELLEQKLRSKREPCMISTGSMTDPYIPLEEQIGNVRKAASLIHAYGFGFSVITKSNRVLRDLDLLRAINEKTKCVVQMTLTTYDEELCRKLEPNVSTTRERFEALQILHEAHIPTIVWLSPILPFINDTKENIEGILSYCIKAKVKGVLCFNMGMTLRQGNREYFYAQLDKLFPGMKERYIKTYKTQYVLSSPNNQQLMEIFHQTCERHHILHDTRKIFTYLAEFPFPKEPTQLTLF